MVASKLNEGVKSYTAAKERKRLLSKDTDVDFGTPEEYAKGGGVKGKGCEQRGTRPAKYY